MECPDRHRNTVESKISEYHFTEAYLGEVYLQDWPSVKCTSCGTEMPLVPEADSFQKLIIDSLLRKPCSLVGDEFCFLRRHCLQLRQVDLASILGLDKAAISRFESDRNSIDLKTDLAIRLLCVASSAKGLAEMSVLMAYIYTHHNQFDVVKPATLRFFQDADTQSLKVQRYIFCERGRTISF